MQILFARHGESQANLLHEISNRGLRHPLTQKGREQALILARKLEPWNITRIYCSPVLRAIETSVLVANHLSVEYEVTDALREYDMGELEGRSDDKTWELWKELFDAWAIHRRWEQHIPGGETFYDVQKRFVPFIQRLIDQYKRTDTNILCIGHGGLYWMMLPLILQNVNFGFIQRHGAFPYASWIASELKQGRLFCVKWNEVLVEI